MAIRPISIRLIISVATQPNIYNEEVPVATRPTCIVESFGGDPASKFKVFNFGRDVADKYSKKASVATQPINIVKKPRWR